MYKINPMIEIKNTTIGHPTGPNPPRSFFVTLPVDISLFESMATHMIDPRDNRLSIKRILRYLSCLRDVFMVLIRYRKSGSLICGRLPGAIYRAGLSAERG